MTKDKYEDNASVVDGKLILSFPNAKTPVVWQMDLADAKASALEVNDLKKDGFALVLKTPKGETTSIAVFDEKEQSVDALMSASKALESGGGQVRPAANVPYRAVSKPVGSGFWKKFFIVIGVLIAAYILLNIILFSMMPRPPSSIQNSSYDAAGAPPSQSPSGVPVSADDFLKRR